MAKKKELNYTAVIDNVGTLTPFVCPVCLGNGKVPNGFYNQTGGKWMTSDATPEKCQSCNGTGIVWG